ncbi:MAG: SprT-like domain-containing protein [Flavobacteriales bacterium]|nr:SprT-like domain-containing protein [Flavobacteriales bacterium]
MVTSKIDLSSYVPSKSIPFLNKLIEKTEVNLIIKNKRKTKLGDYRPPINGSMHQITINNDLNKYQFLITLLHELAHLLNWNRHERAVKSHGIEWKDEFKTLLQDPTIGECFPTDIQIAINDYISNLKSSCSLDLGLQRALKSYDIPTNKGFIADLEIGNAFKTDNGREFKILEKKRKRLKCIEIKTNRLYLFNPAHSVFPL